MLVGDFRLTLQMKLVPNKENSGIQFRSQPFKGHEMKGYQAALGAGWGEVSRRTSVSAGPGVTSPSVTLPGMRLRE